VLVRPALRGPTLADGRNRDSKPTKPIRCGAGTRSSTASRLRTSTQAAVCGEQVSWRVEVPEEIAVVAVRAEHGVEKHPRDRRDRARCHAVGGHSAEGPPHLRLPLLLAEEHGPARVHAEAA